MTPLAPTAAPPAPVITLKSPGRVIINGVTFIAWPLVENSQGDGFKAILIRLVDDYRSPLTMEALCRKWHMTRPTLRTMMKALGEPMREKGWKVKHGERKAVKA